MLGFVPLVAPAVAVGLLSVVLLILAVGYIIIFDPLMQFQATKDSGLFKRFVYWAVGKAVAKIKQLGRLHVGRLITSYLARAKPMIALIGNLEELARRVAGTLGDSAEATYRALVTLRTVTIPRLIEAAVAPVRVQAQQARTLAQTAITRLDQAEAALGTALRQEKIGNWATLPAQLAGLAHFVGNLHAKTWGNVEARLDRLEKTVYETMTVQIRSLIQQAFQVLPQRITALELQVGRITSALGGLSATALAQLQMLLNPALFGLAVLTAVQALAPSLFCRNTTAVSQAVCRQDETLIRDLLAGALVFAIALNPREIARAAGALTGILDGVIRETVAH